MAAFASRCSLLHTFTASYLHTSCAFLQQQSHNCVFTIRFVTSIKSDLISLPPKSPSTTFFLTLSPVIAPISISGLDNSLSLKWSFAEWANQHVSRPFVSEESRLFTANSACFWGTKIDVAPHPTLHPSPTLQWCVTLQPPPSFPLLYFFPV